MVFIMILLTPCVRHAGVLKPRFEHRRYTDSPDNWSAGTYRPVKLTSDPGPTSGMYKSPSEYSRHVWPQNYEPLFAVMPKNELLDSFIHAMCVYFNSSELGYPRSHAVKALSFVTSEHNGDNQHIMKIASIL